MVTFAVPPTLGLLWVLPVLDSEKLVLEQHSITFAYFCCPHPPWGLLPVLPLLNAEKLPLLKSEKQVLEHHSITFAYLCCPRPPLRLLPVLPLLNSEKLTLEQHSITFAYFCCPRPPPGAAAGAAGAEFREPSFGVTLHHFCIRLLSGPPRGCCRC